MDCIKTNGDYWTSAHETTLTCPVDAFSETTTLIFLAWPETVAADRTVTSPDESGFGVTVTVAVALF